MGIIAHHKKDLKDILNILEDMDAELDGDVATCPTCGRDSWSNLQEGRASNEVKAMMKKVRKMQGLVTKGMAL